jgi:hypothetical protein
MCLETELVGVAPSNAVGAGKRGGSTRSEKDAQTMADQERRPVEGRPSGGELARRVVVLIFGIIQVLIVLRIALLGLNAREANSIVKSILDVSQIFVAPFDGILRTDALHASGSTLDITAIVALVGWSVLELVVIWAVRIFRREPT